MARFEKATKSYNEETGEVRFEFANGNSLAININDVPEAVKNHALAHGLLQKIGDSYAGADTVEDAYEAANDTLTTIKSGDWKAARAGVGAGGGDLIKALAAVTGRTEEECKTVVAAADADLRKALRKQPQIAAELAKMQAAKLLAKAAKQSGDVGEIDLAALMS